MKNIYLTSLLVLLCLVAEAQTVAVVDFMKVPANNQDAYMAVEKQWKNLHQSRVQSGAILAWQLYYVRNSGTSSPYNYATITLYENFNKTDVAFTDADLKKAFGPNSAEFMKKTNASRDLIYSETYQSQVGLPSETPNKYLLINQIHTDNVDKYINMEKVGYMPAHAEAIKGGVKNSWGVWTRWPNEDNKFQAVVVDGYTKFSDITAANWESVTGKVLATKKPGEVYDMFNQMSRTDEIRTIVKSEIWELVDTTSPKM
jgi:hypothetical protein